MAPLPHPTPTSPRPRLCYEAKTLRLRVRDNGPGPLSSAQAQALASASAGEPGHGLLGMRERTATVGGSLRTGAAPGGGFLIEAVLPAKPEAT